MRSELDTTKMTSKVFELLSLAPRHPSEFYARVRAIVEVRADKHRTRYPKYRVTDWRPAFEAFGQSFGVDVDGILAEPELHQIEGTVRKGIECLGVNAPFNLAHNGDYLLARLCYLATRTLQPQLILETGVCYGVTSAFLLAALAKNGGGTLHSVDLPPLGSNAHQFVGCLIPRSFQHAWHLHLGPSRRLLSRLCHELQPIDIFVHDSLHTYGNMRAEFATVTPFLSAKSALVADDIQNNCAFEDWIAYAKPAQVRVIQEQSKASFLGFALL